MFNLAGLSNTINAATQLSLHSTNPGLGVSPAAGEFSGAPYARQNCTFNAAAMNGSVAESLLNANVVFNLPLSGTFDAQFIGLWAGATYLGYLVPSTPFTFTGTATERSFTVEATTTKLTRANV